MINENVDIWDNLLLVFILTGKYHLSIDLLHFTGMVAGYSNYSVVFLLFHLYKKHCLPLVGTQGMAKFKVCTAAEKVCS